MTKFYLMTLFAAILIVGTGCSGSGGTTLTVGLGEDEKKLDITSSGTYTSTKTFSMTKDGQTTSSKAVSHYFALANYDLDTSSGMISLEKPLTGADQMRVVFQIVGDEGTDEKAPIKTGTYSATSDKYNKVDTARVMAFADGKEVKNYFNIDKAEGDIKITSVSGEIVTGEIDIKEGDKSVKGSFTAKITARKSP